MITTTRRTSLSVAAILHLPHLSLKISTMSKPFTVQILEQSQISPPPYSAPAPTSLPLTFLDLPWLFFSPGQPLFLYEFPFPISHFTNSTLPKLKHSLSLTLQHYYPFAGTFVSSPEPAKPHLVYTDGDSVSFIVAMSNDDFNYFCSNHARDVNAFHPLVPKLTTSSLLAIQIAVFPNAGICIGLAYRLIVADGRTFNNFIKTWAGYCISESSSFPLKSLPFYDRSVIIDANGLEEVFLKEWRKTRFEQEANVDFSSMVRATFLMDAPKMEKIKNLIIASCKEKNQSLPVHLSPYVLICAFLWICLLKTQQSHANEGAEAIHGDPAWFGFIAGGITRMQFPVPATYLGNCVGFGRASVKRNELAGEEGIVVAARAIGNTIKKLDKGVLAGAEKWISDWEVIYGSEVHVVATWSPKLNLYETDFGWGRPKKIEEISIDRTRAISLIESRDVDDGMEIGLALPKKKMETFAVFFTQGLNY